MKRRNQTKHESRRIDELWQQFSDTGRIGAYLTYKAVTESFRRRDDE